MEELELLGKKIGEKFVAKSGVMYILPHGCNPANYVTGSLEEQEPEQKRHRSIDDEWTPEG